MIEHNIKEGLINDVRKITGPSDASDLPGSLEFSYLVSYTSVINMIIEGSTQMLDKLLPDGYTTVGTSIQLVHENPTLIGEAVNIRIKVKEVNNSRVYLEFEGHDSEGRFCCGKHERHIVNKSRLMQRAYERFPESVNQP